MMLTLSPTILQRVEIISHLSHDSAPRYLRVWSTLPGVRELRRRLDMAQLRAALARTVEHGAVKLILVYVQPCNPMA